MSFKKGHKLTPIKHGAAGTPEYRAWCNMLYRCYRPTTKGYERYGGRGIEVCDEWRDDFSAFLRYVGARPSPTHTLDRIDNDDDYRPGNVEWTTHRRQCFNQSIRKDNRSGVKGVWHDKRLNRWLVHIGQEYIGCFVTKEQAINKRREAEKELI